MGNSYRTGSLAAFAIVALTVAAACGGSDQTAPNSNNPGDSTPVVVNRTGDVAIVNVQFTQGIQNSLGSIPIVLGSRAAVANVYMRAVPASTAPERLILRLFTSTGTLVSSDTITTTGTIDTATPTTPTAQFLVRGTRLTQGMQWQVSRDAALGTDDSASTDVFPRQGNATMNTVSVPALTIRFVPIKLAGNDGSVAPIADDSMPSYLRGLRNVLPLGAINTHIGATFTTNTSFGAAPAGGDATFWVALISQIDLARISDPTEPTVNWFGVVRPPTGFHATTFGGFSYIPQTGTATGANTRTSAAVGPGWFSSPTQSRDLVAHEVGHTMGRAHAPGCGAGAPLDNAYPVPGGLIDVAGFDVGSWDSGDASAAAQVPTTEGDVMGYCFPLWSSTYTYNAILAFRGSQVVADRAPAAGRTHVLAIRGSIDAAGVHLDPTFALDALPNASQGAGAYRVTGAAADGRLLFSYNFDGAVIDHAPGVRGFTVTVPVSSDVESAVASIRVTGPAGSAELRRPAATAVLSAAPGAVTMRRLGNGVVNAGCPTGTRGSALIDGRTGSLVAVSNGASLDAASDGTSFTVLCSDGVRTTRSEHVTALLR